MTALRVFRAEWLRAAKAGELTYRGGFFYRSGVQVSAYDAQFIRDLIAEDFLVETADGLQVTDEGDIALAAAR